MRPPPRSTAPRLVAAASLATFASLLAMGCWNPRTHLPGQTGFAIRSVTINGASFSPGDGLINKLALRVGDMLVPAQPYNPYRVAEDRRRITSFWQTLGYLDAKVTGPEVTRDEQEKKADVTWQIEEGQKYRIGSLRLVGAPPGWDSKLRGIIPFEAGDAIDLERYRMTRIPLDEAVRRGGWRHAEVYSRAFVDRDAKLVHWVYYIDTGPKTVLGKIRVKGNRRVSEQAILDRLGLKPGDPYDLAIEEKLELDLYDTGSFNLAKLWTDADNEFLVGRLPPDRGGDMSPAQIDEDGKYVPRVLPEAINVDVHVVEAPRVKGRVGVGGSVDPERLDATASASLEVRDVFGPFHGLGVSGRVGYGWLFRGATDEPLDLYGEAEVRYEYAGFLARTLDLRVVGRFEDDLFPGFHTRSASGALGFRSALGLGLFLDIEPRFVWETTAGFGPFAEPDAQAVDLATDDYLGGEVRAALTWDRRDHAFEAQNGHLLSLEAVYSPGGPVGTHRYLRLGAEGRVFFQLADNFALGVRGLASWVLLAGDEGVPPGARLYGGGAFGTRGAAWRRLTAYVASCKPDGTGCTREGVGALSLVETSVELRWLPWRKQVGAAVFVDLGGAGPGMNPFEHGPVIAAGLGGRVRLWHVLLSIDLAVRLTEAEGTYWSALDGALDRFLVFARIGEAF